jgi:hypothetical protein
MDYYCINRGTLLDNPRVSTLVGPDQHSVHWYVLWQLLLLYLFEELHRLRLTIFYSTLALLMLKNAILVHLNCWQIRLLAMER